MSTRPSIKRRLFTNGTDKNATDEPPITTRRRDDRLTSARGLALAAVVGAVLWAVLIWAAVQILQRLT